MHPPSDHKWLPKTESEKPSSSNTSSGSTENMPGRIGRVITRAVSTIIPSCSNQQSNRTTGKPPTSNRQYNSTPASGLSSILSRPAQSMNVQPNLPSRRVACELTLADAHHARELSLGAPNTSVASSSQVTDHQQFLCTETLPNPILRTNLITSTPTFKDAQSLNVRPNLPSRRVACEVTLPDAHFHARELPSGAPNTNAASSSQVTDHQPFVCTETLPNPILRTNLLTATPTFKDARVTAPRPTRNYSRKPTVSSGDSARTAPVSRNPVPTINYPHKDKGGTSTRSARKSVVQSPVSSNSKASSRVSDEIAGRFGPILQATPLSPNSVAKVTGGSSSRVTGKSKLVNSTSDQPHSQSKVLANKSLVKATTSDPKGKEKAAVGIQAARTKMLELQAAYKRYEQWLKDHYISASGDLAEPALIPLGEKCQLCAIDIAFLPYHSRDGTSTEPPVCAVLPCGHCAHASCMEQVYGSSLEPQCLSCTSSPAESSK